MSNTVKAATLAGLATGLSLGLSASGAAAAGDPIREIVLLSRPQAAQAQEFQFTQLIAQQWEKLGLKVKIDIMPWEQMADLVWYQRDKWDVTGWQMVGRPERSDPDELLFNLYHSSTAEKGYNFLGYNNPLYNTVVEAQRVETDKDERQKLVFEAQKILAEDQPAMMLVYPQSMYAFNSSVWKADSIIDQPGIGIKNVWTFVGAQPAGDMKDMVLNSSDTVQGINPLWISGGVDSWVTELIWDRLLRIGPDNLPQPWAAESYEWLDETTVEVVLRPGQKWHDGQPLTADDVVFSFQAAMGEEAPMYKPFVSKIADIEKVDDKTLRFHLTEPSAAFLTSSLAKINLIPKHIWEPILTDLAAKPENAESYQEEKPIGSGPFRFVSWKLNEEVVLEANPDHFQKPQMSRWILRIVPNQEAALGMLKSGTMNFLSDYTGDPKVLEALSKEDADISLAATVDIGFRYLAFNNRRPPFDDPAFRRALSFSVPRNLIVGAAFKGFAVPSNSVISPALPFWHNPATDEMQTGLEVAQNILKEAGYTVEDGVLHYPDGVTETLGN
jgi:peptide/nickel transport system substrate-binding protein